MPLGWLWRRVQGRRTRKGQEPQAVIAPAPQPVQKKVRHAAVVLIDVRNAEPVNWDALRADILELCEGTLPEKRARAYRRVDDTTPENQEFLARAREVWEERGYTFVHHRTKDVDMLIAADLVKWIDEILEETDWQEYETVDLKVVLVSGDGDFAPFIRNKRKIHKEKLRLSLHVYARATSLSRKLLALAGPENIRYLEDLPGNDREYPFGT